MALALKWYGIVLACLLLVACVGYLVQPHALSGIPREHRLRFVTLDIHFSTQLDNPRLKVMGELSGQRTRPIMDFSYFRRGPYRGLHCAVPDTVTRLLAVFLAWLVLLGLETICLLSFLVIPVKFLDAVRLAERTHAEPNPPLPVDPKLAAKS